MRENNQLKYQSTIYACYIGYITQAVVNNFAPLLFLTFQKSYGLGLPQITLITTLNFLIQLLVDLAAAGLVDRIGYRVSAVAAHLFAFLGIAGMAFLPELMENSYAGLLAAVVLYAVGGGLLEVIVSPIVEACPTEKKEAVMSLLHSFYCWGHMGVVLLSTLYFSTAGVENWRVLACLWALIPLGNLFFFLKVPLYPIVEEERGMSVLGLARRQIFWVLMLLMLCAGASEHAMAQWSSAFAESALHVSKTVGDLAGPCMFALMMGIARTLYGKYSERISLPLAMRASAALCVAGFLTASLAPWPLLSLAGCGICGFSVGIFWPGTFSLAARALPAGGTAMFAFMALAGDLGCSAGPTLVGFVTDATTGSLKSGLIWAIIFPVLLILGIGRLVLLEKEGKENGCIQECGSADWKNSSGGGVQY